MQIDVPAGGRYVLIVCVPAGERTQVEVRYDEQVLDAVSALELALLGAEDLNQKAALLVRQQARARLMQPLQAADDGTNGPEMVPAGVLTNGPETRPRYRYERAGAINGAPAEEEDSP